MLSFLSHVPIWVGPLFAFLVYRGVAALRTREVAPLQLLVMPVVLLVWSAIGLVTVPIAPQALAVGVPAGLIVGLVIGAAIAQTVAPTVFDARTGRFRIAGSAATLMFMLAIFAAKFALASYGAMHPDLRHTFEYGLTTAAFAGLGTGLFWGRLTVQILDAVARADPMPDFSSLFGAVRQRFETSPTVG